MQYVIQELYYFYFFDLQLIIFCLVFLSAGCGDPTPPVNGSIVEFVNAVVGSQILYSCDPGFLPEGLRTSICSSNMSWHPNPADFQCRNPSELIIMHTTQGLIQLAIPLSFLYIDANSMLVFAPLSVANCHDPIPPMKGSIGGYTNTVEGSVVAFYCNEGLIPAEQMNTTCASDGSWTPNPAELICNEPFRHVQTAELVCMDPPPDSECQTLQLSVGD